MARLEGGCGWFKCFLEIIPLSPKGETDGCQVTLKYAKAVQTLMHYKPDIWSPDSILRIAAVFQQAGQLVTPHTEIDSQTPPDIKPSSGTEAAETGQGQVEILQAYTPSLNIILSTPPLSVSRKDYPWRIQVQVYAQTNTESNQDREEGVSTELPTFVNVTFFCRLEDVMAFGRALEREFEDIDQSRDRTAHNTQSTAQASEAGEEPALL